jgi:hypothetical protein
MTNDELLAEAQRRFPIGSKIKSILIDSDGSNFRYNKEIDIVEGDFYWAVGSKCPACKVTNGYAALYIDNLWATIIEEVKQDIDIVLW